MNDYKVTCLSIDCPERFSLCCGAISERKGKSFVCSSCENPFKGGLCNAAKNLPSPKEVREMFNEYRIDIINKVEQLIAQEIIIAISQHQSTSRLTSLALKVKDL